MLSHTGAKRPQRTGISDGEIIGASTATPNGYIIPASHPG